MENIKKFGAVCGEFQDVSDFITVYIAEAHPFESGDLTDEYEFKYNSHKQMSERIAAAEGLAQKFQVNFLIHSKQFFCLILQILKYFKDVKFLQKIE